MNMFPSSTSSSSQTSMEANSSGSGGGGGLMRYGSAPSSLLTTAVDSVSGATTTRNFSAVGLQTQVAPSTFFPSEASESRAKIRRTEESSKTNTSIGLQRSYGFHAAAAGGSGGASSSLVRHSSSPPGFLNHLATAAGDNGFSITRGIGSSYNSKGIADNSRNISRLNSQLSFTRQKEALSQISEEENIADGVGTDNSQRKSTHSYASAGFGIGSWDDNAITFSVSPTQQAKTIGSHAVNALDNMETQFQFGIPQSALEMATMDKLLHIPQDSVPCKIRAKRGCATHPRSIAERERRTRISGKLKKLQDLVPNMDKQTSYADMLDLAVQHIQSLQYEVQKLNKELDDCTCGCKKSPGS
ncbi:hypothetical protein CDL12_12910 [Handroanthus impetiginosus]|uniref:BHLH domain-containing protein n=1 Tax=Handroanthus impetiginosus TaxID=429701 RepID=A0A2G9HAB8_9LAMI|nr:hypothetical protein CDL12_12910 [Handroanthus impetiginosus]